MSNPNKRVNKKSQSEIICFCNQIPKDQIVKAMEDGACTLNEIYDKTTAGVGPCGGSCRRKIAPLLDEFLKKKV